MIATGCNDRVIDSLIDNNSDDDDIPLNSTPYPALLPVI